MPWAGPVRACSPELVDASTATDLARAGTSPRHNQRLRGGLLHPSLQIGRRPSLCGRAPVVALPTRSQHYQAQIPGGYRHPRVVGQHPVGAQADGSREVDRVQRPQTGTGQQPSLAEE